MRWFLGFLFLAILFSACNKKQATLTESELQLLSLFELSVTDNLEDSDIDSARSLAQKTLGLRYKITDSSAIYNAFIQIGKTYVYQQAYDSGLAYYQKAYELTKIGGNKRRQALALHWIADANVYMGNNSKGATCLIQAIKINQDLGQLLPLATNYSLYAHTFDANYQYDSSLAYFYRAEQIFDSLNDQARKATVLSNIGDVYRSIDDYENALPIMKEALYIHDSLDNIREVARIENTIGTIFMNLNIYDSAIYYYQQSIPNAKSVGYDFMALIARFNLGKVYSLAKDYEQANPILEEVYQFCIDNNISEGQMRCLLHPCQLL